MSTTFSPVLHHFAVASLRWTSPTVHDGPMEGPEVLYAWNGDFALAYRITGSGPIDLLHLPGYTSTVAAIAVLSGVQLMVTGIASLYIGRILAEVQGRPLFLVRETYEGATTTDRG